MIKGKLTWETQVLMVSARANKLLGLLRRTCPMQTDVKVRRSLYLALVKSQMSYATEVRSPSHSTLKQKAERVQRRICWICCRLPMTARYFFIRLCMAILTLILALLRVLVTAILNDLYQAI